MPEIMNGYPDVVFTNGQVITVNHADDIVTTVAVKGNRIVYCGRETSLNGLRGDHTKVIDLKGRTLMPGLIDSHMHFQVTSMLQGPIVKVGYRYAQSIRDIQDLIRKRAEDTAKGDWIVCAGYDNNKLVEGRHPTMEELDEAAPENPVRLGRCDGHMGVCNSLALRICGITPGMGPEEEIIHENGRLTGLLKETAFFDVAKHFRFTKEERLEALRAGNDLLISHGITTVHDAGLDSPEAMRFLEAASRNRDIKVRLHVMITDLDGVRQNEELLDSFIRTGITTGFGNDHFTIGPVKIITDGSSSGPTCVMKEPFTHDPNLKGFQLCSPIDALRILRKAHIAGYRITGHAQGDYSIEFLLKTIDVILTDHPGPECRPRIEHAGMMNPALITQMKRLEVLPIANPGFIELYGSDYLRFYGDRVNYMYPLKSYLEEGVVAAIGSDSPVTHSNPMLAIYGAVTRKDGRTGEAVGADQCIGVMDAIRMYTYNGAYAGFEEDRKGSIEVGKLADLVVLSEDILSVENERIKDILVDLTMIDGEIVYRR